jgi:hypothetical protein
MSATSNSASASGTSASTTDASTTRASSTTDSPTAGETTGQASTAGPTSSDGSTTTGPFDCDTPALFADVQLVDEATSVVAPMTVVAGWGGLPGDPNVAYSPDAESGTITFTVDVPCDGIYHVWGLVWDRVHGVSNCSGVSNPDNFYVQVDSGTDEHWAYGCQGCSNPDEIWAWTSTMRYVGSGCVIEPLSYDLQAGTHTIRFRNREAGTFDDATAPDVAAIAGVAISNASDYDPATDYAP